MKNIVLQIRRGLLGAACLALLTQPGQVSAMSLLQAYDAALQNDPVFRSAVAENQAGQQYRVIGRAGLLPTVQYLYVTSKNRAEITSPDLLGTPATTYPEYTGKTNSISLRQPLFNLEAVARYQQGIAQANFSDAQFAGRAQDLIIRLVSAYVDCKFAEDQMALYAAQRDAFEERKRINARMFEKGEGTRTDMLETEARLDQADAQLIEAADNLASARNTLAAITGGTVMQLDGLADGFRLQPVPLADVRSWEAIALDRNPELSAGRFGVAAAEQEIRKSQAGHAPRLDLNASYGRSKSDSLTTYKQDSTAGSVGVQLVVPLYAGGYVTAVTNQAVANRDKAKSDLQAATNRVMVELHKQFRAVGSSIAKMAALDKAVASAAVLVQATQQSVKGGVRINLDVLNTQQQLVAAKRDLAQARYNYLLSFLKLRLAAGTLDIDDLRTVAAYFSTAK